MKRTKAVRLPPLPSLRAFEAVARLASVKDAADEMKLTASAVSHQLRNLEDHLGVELFKRRNQAIELTEPGELFANYALRAFRELREGVATLRSNSNHNVLHVSAPPLFAMELLIPLLPDFERAHPNIELRLDVGESLADFDNELTDAAIRIGPAPASNLFAERLLDVCMAPVCAPRLLEGPGALKTPEDIQSHALLIANEPHEHDSWESWRSAAGIEHIRPASEVRFDTFLGAAQAAEAGLGIVLAPLPILVRHLAERRLVMPFRLTVPSPWPYRLVCRRSQLHHPKIAHFRRWITEKCATHAKVAPSPCADRESFAGLVERELAAADVRL